MQQSSIPYMLIRGGSSKGVFLLRDDIASASYDDLLLDLMGRDARQIDALGGANALTSKVAIISKNTSGKADVDFLFIQVVVGENRLDKTPNCGNILSGVGIFAIEKGLVKAKDPITSIKVNMLNSNKICELILKTPNGQISNEGSTKIDGVPGFSSEIICNYLNTQGAICGALFPTGNKSDLINGIEVSCMDNGMPVVLLRAKDLGKSGYEDCKELEEDKEFRRLLEELRLKAGPLMKLGEVKDKVVPKMCLVSASCNGADLNTRTFIPHSCHSAIGVLGATTVASSLLFKDTVTKDFAVLQTGNIKVSIEHPSGVFEVNLESELVNGEINIKKAGIIRTARLLSKGEAFIKG